MSPEPYIIGVVPARKGSRGIPDKNVQLLAGIPLIEHTLIAARDARSLDTVLCTTDCPRVRRIAESHDIQTVPRPDALADDRACMRDVAADLHAHHPAHSASCSADRPVWYVFLYPTCPLRTADHIDQCLGFARDVAPFDSVVSVCEISAAPPSGFTLDDEGAVRFVDPADRNYYQRQSKTPKYRLNGAIWVLDARRFDQLNRNMIGERTLAFVMDQSCGIDIDTTVDLQLAELLLTRGARAPVEVTR